MNGNELRAARATLGELWKLGRPLYLAELGRALRLKGRDPGASVLEWERGNGPSGPVSVAIEMMLAGAMPPDGIEAITAQLGRPSLLDHDRNLISTLEGASLVYGAYPDGKPCEDCVSLAHLYGRVGIDVDDSASPHRSYAAIVGGEAVGTWPVSDFGDPNTDEEGCQARALDHARKALGEALQRAAAEIVKTTRERVAAASKGG
ncbi:hypothetical protein [Aquamicrobium soli]|uniref:XRE family transcriptional regulator n=1 Tax=Aquamicrobium soli TaxID=1811518 RepID=A0ABV7KG54_9HYPH